MEGGDECGAYQLVLDPRTPCPLTEEEGNIRHRAEFPGVVDDHG
jgi:hypothetical protein